jgi:hypothetical protein
MTTLDDATTLVNVPLVVARRRSVDSHGPIVFRAFTPVGADLANAFAPDLCRLEYRPLVAELVGPALKVTVLPQQGFEPALQGAIRLYCAAASLGAVVTFS